MCVICVSYSLFLLFPCNPAFVASSKYTTNVKGGRLGIKRALTGLLGGNQYPGGSVPNGGFRGGDRIVSSKPSQLLLLLMLL